MPACPRLRGLGRASSIAMRLCRSLATRALAYPRRTVRLVEIRLLEGPNVYRLEPVVKLESPSAGGGPGTASAIPARHALVQLGARPGPHCGRTRSPRSSAWVRGCAPSTARDGGGLAVHRSSDPGPLDRHVPVDGRRARADDRRGRASPWPIATSAASRGADLTGAPATDPRALDRADRRGADDAARLDPRRRAADPDRVRSPARTARARSPG